MIQKSDFKTKKQDRLIRESELKTDRHNRQIQKSELKTKKQDRSIKESELKTNRYNRPIQKSELGINRLYRQIQSEDRIGIGRSINRTLRPPLLRANWLPPPPFPQESAPSPLEPGGGNTRLRERGLGEPIRTTGEKAWHSVDRM
jgi:hypothetical protein